MKKKNFWIKTISSFTDINQIAKEGEKISKDYLNFIKEFNLYNNDNDNRNLNSNKSKAN